MARSASSVLLAAAAGAVMLTPVFANAAEPAPGATPDAAAQQHSAARAAVVAKGKRLSGIATGLTVGSLTATLLSIYSGNNSNYPMAIGLASAGVVLAGAAIPIAVAGARRIRHPERFVAKHQVSVGMLATPRVAAVSVRLRF